MAQNYEDIVRDWYNRLRPEFLRRLTAKYSGLSLYDAENIYQDTFIAIQENLMRGRIKEDTSWSSYIMTIGMNLASKEWRKVGKIDSADRGFDDDEPPEPCGSLIILFYYENLSMDEIAERIGYKNATTAKSKKSQCMKDLIRRVKNSLLRAGILD